MISLMMVGMLLVWLLLLDVSVEQFDCPNVAISTPFFVTYASYSDRIVVTLDFRSLDNTDLMRDLIQLVAFLSRVSDELTTRFPLLTIENRPFS